MKYLTKRRRIKSIAYAAILRSQYTAWRPEGYAQNARHQQWCEFCGSEIAFGELIQRYSWWRDNPLPYVGWKHLTCPDPIVLLRDQLEEVDDIVPIKPHAQMQGGRCTRCHTSLTGSPGWLAIDKVSSTPQWFCEGCVNGK